MKPKSSGFRARRSLTFEERPYAGKTFYLDVKSASAKSKISQRIHNLGGQIEDFLSKDLTLLITDKTSTKLSKDDCSQKQTAKNVPLSRGQALLLKASSNQNCDANNNSNGLLQSAAKLGLQIETPAGFLRDSSKHLPKLKAETSKMDTSMSGMSPITWDSEKENGPIIKVEDEEGLYRPLFKQFETFPQIFYNETGSPFDVGVVLTKPKESNNQSKKKSVGGVLRGGYCESCDHWYKCSLREHLNSEKHKEFVSVAENFETLNHTSASLPNLKNFVGKYGLKECNTSDSPEILSRTPNFSSAFVGFETHNKDLDNNKLDSESAYNVTSQNIEGLIIMSEINQDSEKKIRGRHLSNTEPMLDRNLNHNAKDTPHSQPVNIITERFSKHPKENFKKMSLNEVKSSKSEKGSESSLKMSSSLRMGRKFSVDDVIKSVTDNEEYFSSGEDYDGRIQVPMSKTSCIITKHLTSDASTNVSLNNSLCCSSHSNVAGSNPSKGAGSSHSNFAGPSHVNIAGSKYSNDTASCHRNISGSSHGNFLDSNHSIVAGFCHSNVVGSNHSNAAGTNDSNVVGSCHSNIVGSSHSNTAGSSHRNNVGLCHSNFADSFDSNLAGLCSGNVSAIGDSNRINLAIDKSNEISKQDTEVNVKRFQDIPLMHFSSSSFGDNGVSNVLSFLNSQHSRKSCDGESLENAGNFFNEDVSVAEGSGNSTWALDKLSEVTYNNGNIPHEGCNELRQSTVNGNVLEHFIDDVSSDDNKMPILQAEIESDNMGVELDLMPVLESYDTDKPQPVISIPLPEYSNITEESLQEKPQVETDCVIGQNLQTSYDIPLFNLKNSDVKDVTPDKSSMNNLKSKIYKSQTNSGSTIRNWLLPNDDTGSVRSVNSPGNLNATLVNTSCNVFEKSHVESGNAITKNSGVETTSLNDIKETADSSKVADWIQRQDFVVADDADENSHHGFETNILNAGFPNSINENDKGNYEMSLKSCSEIKYGSEKVDIDERSNVWSDTGTSISDCTLDNFRIGGGVENNSHTGVKNSQVRDISKEVQSSSEIMLIEEMSQDSNNSAKTGLTSIVTARGIKIKGLSSLSSHFFNAVDSDVFTGTESSTVAYGNSRRNSECSFADSTNKIKPNVQTVISNSQQSIDTVNQVFNMQTNQNHHLNNNTIGDDNFSEFDYSSGAKSNIVAAEKSSQKKTKSKNIKLESSTKKARKSQAKAKNPTATKTTKSKNKTKSHNLLNQVLTSNLYSPVSSVTEYSPSRNSYTDQTYSQHQQSFSHNVSEGNLPSSGFQKNQDLGYFPQNPNNVNGQFQDGSIHYSDPYRQNNGEFRMIDLLLSPGEQGSKFHLEKFQQNMCSQQHSTHGIGQVNNVGWNGGNCSNFLSQQNIHHQFGVLPFSGAYQTQDKVQGNKENNHQFLSSNSNFFMHNWNTGPNVQQQNHSSQQEPGYNVNYPASPYSASHDHSRSNGSLQTIEMSHIADSNGVCENNFNFKIADTKKLKSNGNVKKKPKEKKQMTQRKKTSAISLNSTVQSVSPFNNKSLNTDGLKPAENGQHLAIMSLPYTYQNHFPNVYSSSHSSQPLHINTNDSQNLHSISHSFSSSFNQTSSGRSVNVYNGVQAVNLHDNIQTSHMYSTNQPVNMFGTSNSANIYNTTQTGETKLTIRRASTDDPPPISNQSKHDLMQYWNVRKAGDCRLVFSANMVGIGKRKAEAETPTKLCMSQLNRSQTSQPILKRRKCLVY